MLRRVQLRSDRTNYAAVDQHLPVPHAVDISQQPFNDRLHFGR